MKNVWLYIVGFIIGAGILFGYAQFKAQKSQPIPASHKQTPSSTFSVETPPSESLQGTIASRAGTLFWESRIATVPSELKENVPIQQGEQLITEEKSTATVKFDTASTITLSENSDISFIQTLPVDFVVGQIKGTIKYVMDGTTPLSIRVRNALITKTSGIIQITVTDADPIILISTLQGTAQIGFNDLDYVSQVFTLREGQVYEYNSDEHTAINTKNK